MTSIFITDVGVSVEDPSYTVDESDGTVEVCVVLTGTIERNVSVTISTSDGSTIGRPTFVYYFQLHFSTAPDVYTSTETDLTFTPGRDRLCVNIPIGNNTVVERNENFTVTVTSNDPSVQIEPNSNSTATIVDDDGK